MKAEKAKKKNCSLLMHLPFFLKSGLCMKNSGLFSQVQSYLIFESSFPPPSLHFLPSFSFFILSYSPSFIFLPSGHTEISKHPIECRDTVQVNSRLRLRANNNSFIRAFQFCVFKESLISKNQKAIL